MQRRGWLKVMIATLLLPTRFLWSLDLFMEHVDVFCCNIIQSIVFENNFFLFLLLFLGIDYYSKDVRDVKIVKSALQEADNKT